MELIILIPAVLCWIALGRNSARKALINVYLPVVLLLPAYFRLRFPHMPPITFADAAILPLALAMFRSEMGRWRLQWMDLWVVLLALVYGASEAINTQIANGGLALFAGITNMVLPYMAGKLLIEQDHGKGQPFRTALVRRFVVLWAAVGVVSIYDFLSGKNSWQAVFTKIIPSQPVLWPMQMRWGFGRIAGPYSHAILAGIVFLMGLIYCLWLRRTDPAWGSRRVFGGIPLAPRGVVLGAIVLGLLMTQSRGPWIGVGLALLFAVLVRMLPFPRATAVFLLLVAVLSVAGFAIGKAYTDSGMAGAKDEEQRNAAYRRELLGNYIPVVLARPMLGWGVVAYPAVDGKMSIDNEYLLTAVTHGLIGLGLFLAILGGSAARLFRMAARPLAPDDRALVFAHLAVLMGLAATITTVFLGEQALILCYLIVGWIHGLNPVVVGEQAALPFKFRRVLV